MKLTLRASVAAMLFIVVVATFSIVDQAQTVSAAQSTKDDTFYVGVTYCGNSVSEAKLLIDKVKDYTNLFILQSGPLQQDGAAINETGDYAVANGMHFMVYLGINSVALANNWLSTYDGHWGNYFLGIYMIDEPGGKMLDGGTYLINPVTQEGISKAADGTITSHLNGTQDYFMRNGTVIAEDLNGLYYDKTLYYSNGTVTAQDWNGTQINPINASLVPFTYDELWNACPIQNYTDAAKLFIGGSNNSLRIIRNDSNCTFKVFTSDYALQWFDYQSGYDVVLTEFGSNQSTTQEIAQTRGAANAFGKDWGTMITWKYTQAPYLASGDEIYQQMCQAYENGAKYIAIFNYAPDMQGPYGTLTQDHFDALQRFWTDEINNPNVIRGQVKGEAAFILPQNFGSGLRNQQDIVWGFWAPTPEEQQIWIQLQNALATYGQKLDIVYSDLAHPLQGKYSVIIDPTNLVPAWLIIALVSVIAFAVLGAGLLVYKFKRRR